MANEHEKKEILERLAAEAQESLKPIRIPLEGILVPGRLENDGKWVEDQDGKIPNFKIIKYSDEHRGVKAPGGNVFKWFTQYHSAGGMSMVPSQGEEIWLLASDQEPRWLLCDTRIDQDSPQVRMLWENLRRLTSEEVAQRDQHLDFIIQWLKQYYAKT